jgi:hypothetical protein
MNTPQQHTLTDLSLPDRYETLAARLGVGVANLLVAPSKDTLLSLEALVQDARTRGEGLLVPMFGDSGAGKTTLVMNLDQWMPADFAPTLAYDGALEYDDLVAKVSEAAVKLPANNSRLIAINIDHRESSPPTDEELGALKRFLRTNPAKVPCLVFWPETSLEMAKKTASRWETVTGAPPITMPLQYDGPQKAAWAQIAIHTLSLANNILLLEDLGINPKDYNANEFSSLGAYLRKLSQDFNKQVRELRAQLAKQVSIAIAFVSTDSEPGVLTQLTNNSRYGLLEAHALISVTSESEIGKWWASRRGLLTRAIVQLDAHAFCLPPAASASCIRNFSDDDLPVFEGVDYRRYGPAHGARDLSRCDLGKFVVGKELNRFEARGTTADKAGAAFAALAGAGFTMGKDRKLNQTMAEAWKRLLEETAIPFEKIESETKLEFCNLIPDNSIHFADRVLCIEYTWRKGSFLEPKNRAAVATYILQKLQGYVRQQKWTDA